MEKVENDLLFFKSLEIYHVVQPIIDLRSKRIYGYEYLLRSRQSPNPEMLFSKARENDLLLQMDMKSIFTIIENAHIRNFKDGYLFINVFPSTFVEPIFLYKLKQLISLTNIKTNSIVFELNESEMIVDFPVLRQFIKKYREEGFLISIDDMGKGEANIKAMIEIEPDIVKLDRYYSENLSRSKRKQKVIQFCLDFLDENTTLVLEGIECEEDLQVAQELQVPLAQGYYLGKPNSIDFYIHRESFIDSEVKNYESGQR